MPDSSQLYEVGYLSSTLNPVLDLVTGPLRLGPITGGAIPKTSGGEGGRAEVAPGFGGGGPSRQKSSRDVL